MNPAFRDQLFEAAEQAAFPAEPLFDEASGATTFDAESTAVMARLFDLFGVSALRATDADIDRIINTACTLSAEVAQDVHSLAAMNGDVAALPEAADWHPDYRDYVSALWQGDRVAIARCAAALGLPDGIPNGSLPLKDGPLA